MRTVFGACGVVAVALFLSTGSEVAAQGKQTWRWVKYVDGKGVLREHPRWKDVGNNEVELLQAQGIATVAKGKTVTKAVIEFRRSTGPMQWEPQPYLTCTDNGPLKSPNPPNPMIDEFIVTWADGNNPKKKCTKGIGIRMDITLSIQDAAGVVTDHLLDTLYTTADPF